MQKEVKDTINLLIKALSENFTDFHGLYLYGAYADGIYECDDDLEVVAIFDYEDKQKRELIWPIIGKIESETGFYIDLHPLTMEEFKKDEEFYEEVVNEGIFFDSK